VAVNLLVYFYARLAHALTPQYFISTNAARWLWFQFVTIDWDLFLPSPKGASPYFQKGPEAYWPE
jgi:hypothetical protein